MYIEVGINAQRKCSPLTNIGSNIENCVAIAQYLAHETQLAVAVDVVIIFTVIAVHIVPTKLIQVGIVRRHELGNDGYESFHNHFNISVLDPSMVSVTTIAIFIRALI